jgi:hypothetical protein
MANMVSYCSVEDIATLDITDPDKLEDAQAMVDRFPPYIIQEDGVIIPNIPDSDPNNAGHYLVGTGNPMYVLGCALDNAGYKVFPNVVRLNPAFGQVFEDLIVTCRVSDGVATDKETFPVSIVNYPVTNYPPLLNDIDDQAFEVNKLNTYQLVAHDPDAIDMLGAGLTWSATLNGLPNYQVGPYQQQIINPKTGLIAFTPLGEGALTCIVTVQDPRGMWAVGEFTIFCANPGTWFNHPPVVLGDLDSPQTIRAGQMFIANEMDFIDPDGDKLYYSTNIGAVGENGVYTFQTNFPGQYLVQVTAYDIRGGAVTTEFILHVMPWWSI